MTRYRRKPVEVEAWQVGSDEPCPDWILSARFYQKGYNGDPDMWFVLCADDWGTSFHALVGNFIINDGGYYSMWPSDVFDDEYGVYGDYEVVS